MEELSYIHHVEFIKIVLLLSRRPAPITIVQGKSLFSKEYQFIGAHQLSFQRLDTITELSLMASRILVIIAMLFAPAEFEGMFRSKVAGMLADALRGIGGAAKSG